jgi:hypothetical protein
LGIEEKILDQIKERKNKDAVVFIGGLRENNKERTRLIEMICKEVPSFKFYGIGTRLLDQNSPIWKKYHKEKFGLEMYDILLNSKITINQHCPEAEDYACNMRLFEATGTGSLVITDHKKNISELFTPGREIITYKSHKECIEKIRYFLRHEEERKRIARAGQARTLKEHTYLIRMKELLEIIKRNFP